MTEAFYTHISMVVDRSNSMNAIKAEMQDAINVLIADQFQQSGKLTFTLTEFDTVIDDVHRMSSTPFLYELKPRLATSLFDAVGTEIDKTLIDLAALPVNEKPERVLFVVVTDGLDNRSFEYNEESVRSMIARLRETENWDFQFLGVDETAWQGEKLGIPSTRVDSLSIKAIMAKLSKEMVLARGDKLYIMKIADSLLSDARDSGLISPTEAAQLAEVIDRKLWQRHRRNQEDDQRFTD